MAIDVSKFIHPLDAKAMRAMEAVPGFSIVTNAVMKFYDDRLFHGMNMASKVRLGPDQLPQVYALLVEVCERLGMDVPELYLENGRNDAYSLGDKRPFIVVQSGLLSCLTMTEIKSVMACMCAHILCRHNRYETMGRVLTDFGSSALGLASSITKPVYWAIQAWLRCAGFTADRIDAYVMDSADIVVKKHLKLKGGIIYNHEGMDLDPVVYLQQARDYEEELTLSKVQQLVQKWNVRDLGNPFPVIRCLELKRWFDNGGLDSVRTDKDRKALKWD